jgi:hypothetical protein
MIAIMWQVDVKNGRETEFEHLYGVDGEWTVVNRQSRSYLGTSFLHDQNRRSRYVVIEYWSEMIVYEQHRVSRSAKVDALKERSATLVDSVEPLGVFTALDVPDRSGPTWSQRRQTQGLPRIPFRPFATIRFRSRNLSSSASWPRTAFSSACF